MPRYPLADMPDDIDPGVRPYVEILHEAGVETFESCEGGPGHCGPDPWIRMPSEVVWAALTACLHHALPVVEIREREYHLANGSPVGPHARIVFGRKATETAPRPVTEDPLDGFRAGHPVGFMAMLRLLRAYRIAQSVAAIDRNSRGDVSIVFVRRDPPGEPLGSEVDVARAVNGFEVVSVETTSDLLRVLLRPTKVSGSARITPTREPTRTDSNQVADAMELVHRTRFHAFGFHPPIGALESKLWDMCRHEPRTVGMLFREGFNASEIAKAIRTNVLEVRLCES